MPAIFREWEVKTIEIIFAELLQGNAKLWTLDKKIQHYLSNDFLFINPRL